MLVFFALGNAKVLSFALADAKVPDARYFAFWWNIGSTFHFLCVNFIALGSKHKPYFQWNIGCLGSLALGLCVGHVHFIFFVLISFAFCSRRKPVFSVEYGLNIVFSIAVFSHSSGVVYYHLLLK